MGGKHVGERRNSIFLTAESVKHGILRKYKYRRGIFPWGRKVAVWQLSLRAPGKIMPFGERREGD